MSNVPFRSRIRSFRKSDGVGRGADGFSDVAKYSGSGDFGAGVEEGGGGEVDDSGGNSACL
jgi:hypothetical protein